MLNLVMLINKHMRSHKDILGCKEGGGQNKANGPWAEFCETFPYKYNFDFYLFYFLPVLLAWLYR